VNDSARPSLRLVDLFRRGTHRPLPDFIGTFMARDALSLAASYAELRPGDGVLLPAFACREVIKPFIGTSRIRFYDIDPDLTVDPAEIERLLKQRPARIVLIINYFGFLQPHRHEIKRIAAARGAILIEDCAHSLLTEGSGVTGDLAVYSLRKIIPVPDGGGLRVNASAPPPRPDYFPQLYSDVLSFLALTKSLIGFRSEALSRAGMATARGRLREATRQARRPRRHRTLPLSSLTSNGLSHVSLSRIADARRSDYLLWERVAPTSGSFTPIFRGLPPGVCPLGVPVIAADRPALRATLASVGIATKVHWDLLSLVPAEHVRSHDLAKHILTLPVYPELSEEHRALLRSEPVFLAQRA
jgi:hypothetical protein